MLAWQEITYPGWLALSWRDVLAGAEPLLLLAQCDRLPSIG
jgi:hypothetical protein